MLQSLLNKIKSFCCPKQEVTTETVIIDHYHTKYTPPINQKFCDITGKKII